MNIYEAVNKCLQELDRAERTIMSYRNGLNTFQEYLIEQKIPLATDVSTLKPQVFISFVPWLSKKDYTKATKQQYLVAMKRLFRWLTEQEYISPTPAQVMRLETAITDVSKIHQNHLPKVPTDAQTDAILQAAVTQDMRSPIKERDIALLYFLAYTGCRNQEAQSLLVNDINFTTDPVTVSIRESKGDADRFVYLTTEAANYIQQYWIVRGWSGKDDPAFARHDRRISKDHEGMTTNSIRDVVVRIKKLAGVDKFTPHYFRHHFVTKVVAKKGVAKARELAGHKNIATTMVYTKITQEELKSDYNDVFD